MAYLAAIQGAKGLLYYMGGSAARIEGETNEQKPWGYLHDLVPELSSMIPVFVAPEADDKVAVVCAPAYQGGSGGDQVDVCLKVVEKTYTLIAVNRSDRPVDATITGACLGSARVEVLFESREARAKDGVLSVAFGAYAVHIYRWR